MPQMPDVLEGKGYRFSGHTRDPETESNCDHGPFPNLLKHPRAPAALVVKTKQGKGTTSA